jgi:4'-phosphopantetheinyl transferase EntD
MSASTPWSSGEPGPFRRLIAEPTVHIAEADPRLVEAGAGLFPEEERLVERAVESRRRQFTTGRLAARRAWQELGVAPLPLLNDAQRVPLWPAGLVGSITHTHGWCAAAVAHDSDVYGIGLDVEAATPLDVELWERVCRPEERSFLEPLPLEQRGLLAKALFSAKESIYKALYPRIRVFLDFQGMRIDIAPLSGNEYRWQAELQVPWGPLRARQRFGAGRMSVDTAWIATAVVLEADALGEELPGVQPLNARR